MEKSESQIITLITTADPECIYRSQEAKIVALEPPSLQ